MMDVFDLSELCHGDRRVGWQPAPTGAESRHSAGIHMSQPPWREESGGEGPWRTPQGGSRRCGALNQELGWSASSWGWPSTKGAAYSGKCGLHQPWASEDLALSPADPGWPWASHPNSLNFISFSVKWWQFLVFIQHWMHAFLSAYYVLAAGNRKMSRWQGACLQRLLTL